MLEVIAEEVQPHSEEIQQHWKQVDLFKELGVEAEFTSDDWETPNSVAKSIASLVMESDRRILEPAAGRGQIVKYLPSDRYVIANEIKSNRFRDLRDRVEMFDRWRFTQFDFLAQKGWYGTQDLVVGNPPFSLWADFLDQSLKCLDPASKNARVLFLLPGDFSQSVSNAAALDCLNCHISHRYKIVGRVGYLKEGQRFKQRQVYDCVFEFKKGRDRGSESVLCQAN